MLNGKYEIQCVQVITEIRATWKCTADTNYNFLSLQFYIISSPFLCSRLQVSEVLFWCNS